MSTTTLLMPKARPDSGHSTTWRDGRELQPEDHESDSLLVSGGLEAREGERSGHVAELPEEEPEVRDEHGDGERHQVDPVGVTDGEEHGGDEAHAHGEAAERDGHDRGEARSWRPTTGEMAASSEVHGDDRDGDRGRRGALGAPDHGGDEEDRPGANHTPRLSMSKASSRSTSGAGGHRRLAIDGGHRVFPLSRSGARSSCSCLLHPAAGSACTGARTT